MSVEFVDTNVFVYAHNSAAEERRGRSIELLAAIWSGAQAREIAHDE